MRRQLVPGLVVRLTVIKAKTRPGIEAKCYLAHLNWSPPAFFDMKTLLCKSNDLYQKWTLMPNYFLDTYSYYAKIIPSIINQGLILGIGEQTVDFRLHLENYLSIITVTSCKLIEPASRRLIFQFYVIKNINKWSCSLATVLSLGSIEREMSHVWPATGGRSGQWRIQDFWKGGSRKGSERKARAEILATPPPQLVIDHVDNHRACAYYCCFRNKFTCSYIVSRRLSNY